MKDNTELVLEQIDAQSIDDKRELRGHIDYFSTSSVTIGGWVARLGSEAKVNIKVILDSETVGEGCANIYRADLEAAGVNEGEHGFVIPVRVDAAKMTGKAIFSLIDADTLEIIEGITYEVEYSTLMNKFNTKMDQAGVFFDDAFYRRCYPGVWGWEHYAHHGQYENKLPNENIVPEALERYFRADEHSIPLLDMLCFAKEQEGVNFIGPPELSIIILNWNKSLMTLQCVYTIFKNSFLKNIEVVVVDNGSRDDEFGKLLELRAHPRVKIIRNKSNRFYGEANNIGVEAAASSTICLLNNDAFVGWHWDMHLLDELNSSDEIGGVGPKFLFPNGVLQEAGGELNPCGQNVQIGKGLDPNLSFFNRNADVTHVSTACFILSKALYSRVNGFDYCYEPAYFEDADLTSKISVLGYRVRYVSKAEVIHVENATSKEPDIGFNFGSLISTNRMKFVEKWGDYLRGGESPIIPDFTEEYLRTENYKDSDKIAVVYSPYNLTPGGGERYILSLALAAKESGYITFFCTPERYSKFRLHTVAYALGLDVSGINLLGEAELDRMQDISLFIVMGNELSPPMRAKGKDRNIYHCQFPFPMSDWHKANCLSNVTDYDKVIVNSMFTKNHYLKEAQRYYITVPEVVVISPPVDMIDKLDKPSDGVVRILNVGRFIAGGHCKKQKELVIAYNALYEKLAAKGISSQFTLMGSLGSSEEDRLYLSEVRELSGPGVDIILNASRESVVEKYQESNVYWHGTGIGESLDKKPEVFEHFGITPVEAMSAGCIPIVWHEGGPKEVVKMLGLDENKYCASQSEDYVSKTIELVNSSFSVDTSMFSEKAFIKKLIEELA